MAQEMRSKMDKKWVMGGIVFILYILLICQITFVPKSPDMNQKYEEQLCIFNGENVEEE